jgi:hypothetical protein
MKTILVILCFLILSACVRGKDSLREFDHRAYVEFARCLNAKIEDISDQTKAANILQKQVPVGVKKSEAINRLREIAKYRSQYITYEWELTKNPMGMSIVYTETGRALSIVIILSIDENECVKRISVGEFEN